MPRLFLYPFHIKVGTMDHLFWALKYTSVVFPWVSMRLLPGIKMILEVVDVCVWSRLYDPMDGIMKWWSSGHIFCLSQKSYVILFCTLKERDRLDRVGHSFPQCTVVSQRSTYKGPYWEGLALGGAGGLGRLANLGRLSVNSDPWYDIPW